MKLVINTQFRENYGAHDWNGEGTCPQYWKNKGGEVFVVEGFSWMDYDMVKTDVLAQCRSLIESKDEYSEEYITSWSLEEDDEVVCEEWESPTILSNVDGKWMATKTTSSDYGWRGNFVGKCESWELSLGSLRVDGSYSVIYNHKTEGWVDQDRMVEILRAWENDIDVNAA